jgi:hypothetical protein
VAYLPIFCIPLKHQRIFWFADLPGVFILDLFDIDLCLNAVIFGECALVSLL